MSMQLHVAFPEVFKGVGLIAGGPPGSFIGGRNGYLSGRYKVMRAFEDGDEEKEKVR